MLASGPLNGPIFGKPWGLFRLSDPSGNFSTASPVRDDRCFTDVKPCRICRYWLLYQK
jgi:hypothetical protein